MDTKQNNLAFKAEKKKKNTGFVYKDLAGKRSTIFNILTFSFSGVEWASLIILIAKIFYWKV